MSMPEDLNESISNLDWIKLRIKRARTFAELENVLETIDYDEFEEMDWTLDPANLSMIHELFRERRSQIQKANHERH